MEEDHLSHDKLIKNTYYRNMKKIIILISAFILINNITFAAGGDSGNSTTKISMYDEAVKLIKRAGKLEKKKLGKTIRKPSKKEVISPDFPLIQIRKSLKSQSEQ